MLAYPISIQKVFSKILLMRLLQAPASQVAGLQKEFVGKDLKPLAIADKGKF